VGAAAQEDRINRLAAMLGLEHLLERDVENLSGGESQKVAFARALAIEPPILLLDEPLAPLDPPSREGLREEIIKMHGQMSTTTVHVTHDQLTARILADHIGVMHNGVLRQFGPAEDVFHRPADEFVARFVGMENVFNGRAAGGADGAEIDIDGIVLKSATDLRGAVGLCISPEMIHLVTKGGRTFANALQGTVRAVSDRGSVFRVIIDVAGRLLTAHLGRREYEQDPIAAGAAVTVGFDPDDVHCFHVGGA
ncbi:MAG: ABC transporter ATP-binding protein, partial [Planctomycetes bacterium]|nr:ABC transporter ATP-binding protein [Planctomycetota bacterium]